MTKTTSTSTVDNFHTFNIDNDHPLAQELVSLRSAVARYQREAYTTSVQLQRYSLEVSNASNRCRLLESQNTILKKELDVLRDHPDTHPHKDTLRVQEMTLALRRLSEKLDATEGMLFQRNMELAQALSDRENAYSEVMRSRVIMDQLQSKGENYIARVRQLEFLLESTRHERHMANFVIQDYAELVKSLEGRHDSRNDHNLTIPSLKSHNEEKENLQKLLEENYSTKLRLETDLIRVQAELEEAQSTLELGRQNTIALREKLSAAQVELERLKIDDSTAAKMVSRYMKFSQSSTDVLHTAMANLRLRHEAILTGMEAQLYQMESSVVSANMRAERLRHALDELTEDIARESYGRRREISLRLIQVSREEKIVDGLQQWSMKATKALSMLPDDLTAPIRDICIQASTFLTVLGNSGRHEDAGSVARVIMAQDIVEKLTAELRSETERRLASERRASAFEQRDQDHKRLQPNSLVEPNTSLGGLHMVKNGYLPMNGSDEESRLKEKSSTGTQTEYLPPSIDYDQRPSTPLKHEISSYCEDNNGVSLSTPEIPACSSSTDTEFQPGVGSQKVLGAPGLSVNLKETREGSDTTSVEVLSIDPQLTLLSSTTSKNAKKLSNGLLNVKNRYEIYQRGFRDCHIALEKLKQQAEFVEAEGSRNLLNVVLTRLNDFNEDARVEVEIRITDEERITTGFETLIAFPKVLTEGDENDLYEKVQSFIDGDHESTRKVISQLQTKLEDVQHDIASVKHAIHENSLPNPISNISSWSSWTGLLPSSRPPSPSPSRSPTFGAVITSPRLRPPSTVKWPQGDTELNVFASLKLRISMPAYYSTTKPVSRTRTTSLMYSLGIGNHEHALSRTPSISSTMVYDAKDLESNSLPSEDVE